MTDKTRNQKVRRVAKADENRINSAIAALLHSPDGRGFLWWLFNLCNEGQTTFTGNALSSAFAQGEANIGLRLKQRILEIDPDGYILFLKETLNERRDIADRIDRTPRDYNYGDDSGHNDA